MSGGGEHGEPAWTCERLDTKEHAAKTLYYAARALKTLIDIATKPP